MHFYSRLRDRSVYRLLSSIFHGERLICKLRTREIRKNCSTVKRTTIIAYSHLQLNCKIPNSFSYFAIQRYGSQFDATFFISPFNFNFNFIQISSISVTILYDDFKIPGSYVERAKSFAFCRQRKAIALFHF